MTGKPSSAPAWITWRRVMKNKNMVYLSLNSCKIVNVDGKSKIEIDPVVAIGLARLGQLIIDRQYRERMEACDE